MDKEKKEASEQEIKTRVKEWLVELINHFEKFGFSDYHRLEKMRCPKCNGELEYDGINWTCRWRNCNFFIPRHLEPPTISALEDLYKEKARKKSLQKTEDRVSEILRTY